LIVNARAVPAETVCRNGIAGSDGLTFYIVSARQIVLSCKVEQMTSGNQRQDTIPATQRKAFDNEALTRGSDRELRLNFKQAAILAAVPITATSGNTLLALGMRQVGRIGVHNWQLLFSALINPYILAGILLLIGFFSSYLFALSWADLTYVIPTTSFGYILVPLISHFVLNESISQYRWMGIVLISCGVVIGAHGPLRSSSLPGHEGIR
jgi:uncharacterized membrane protein